MSVPCKEQKTPKDMIRLRTVMSVGFLGRVSGTSGGRRCSQGQTKGHHSLLGRGFPMSATTKDLAHVYPENDRR
jgi:hypothetical protein